MKNDMPNPLPEEQYMLLSGYVLGDLTTEEMTQVEQLAQDNPGILKELRALQASFELIPQGLTQIAPPASLRERIVAPSKADKSVSADAASADTDLSVGTIGGIWKVLVGLVAISTLALSMDNFRLRQQLVQQAESERVARLQLEEQLAQQAESEQTAKRQLEEQQQAESERVASILQQPTSRLIALTGDDNESAGTLLFTPGNWKEVIVSLGDLPPLPPEQIYRMWLALDNSTVIYCGEFNTGDDGSVFVRFTPTETPPKGVKTTELFVTIEGSQTSPTPSGDRVMTGPI